MANVTSANNKFKLIINQNNQCFYCGKEDPSSVSHVYLKKIGGFNHISNLVMACSSCTRIKAAKSMEEFRPRLAFDKSKYKGIIGYKEYVALRGIGELDALGHYSFFWELKGITTVVGGSLTKAQQKLDTDEIVETPVVSSFAEHLDAFIRERERHFKAPN